MGYESPQRAFEHLRALADGTTCKHKLQAIILPSLLEGFDGRPDAGLLATESSRRYGSLLVPALKVIENIVGKRLMFLLGTRPSGGPAAEPY